MLNSHESDPCCGKAISEALLSGALDTADSWNCPDCGTEWRPRVIDPQSSVIRIAKRNGWEKYLPEAWKNEAKPGPCIRYWEPHISVAIVRTV